MPEPLDQEKLKSEIAKTRAHLEWLESLVEQTGPVSDPQPQVDSGPVLKPEPVSEPEPQAESLSAETAPAEDVDHIFETFAKSEPSMAEELRKFKIGCIGIAILVAGGIIFTIYVLPYLID